MSDVIIAAAAAILVCIQSHRNYLMIQAAKPKEDRTADALEKILEQMHKDAYLREVDRKFSRKTFYR